MLYFDEYGKKENPTILLLHGAAALDTFCNQYCFSEKYHLIVPHLYGAGKSADKVYEPEMMKKELFTLIDSLHKDKVGVIGHSLGAQIAVMLVCERPEQFNFAVFLSAWVNPNAKAIRMYCSLAGLTVRMLHWKWLVCFQGKYWHYTSERAKYMAEYSKQLTPQIYKSFFENTLDLRKLPAYPNINVPMLAICGSKEVKDMKISLDMLGSNPHCQAMILPRAGHDFPMRKATVLNPILERFILQIRDEFCYTNNRTEKYNA
jgi:pimeloyl-ACP methyl ester carboxylesterase